MHRNQRSRRKGTATLEFALFLPTLAMVFALLLWHGGFLRGMLETRVAVREQAFDRVKTPTTQEIFRFDLVETMRETKRATHAYQPAWLSMMPKPESRLAIVRGTWDRRALPMDRPIHWEVLTRVVTDTVQSIVGALSGFDPSSLANFDIDSVLSQIDAGEALADSLIPSWLDW